MGLPPPPISRIANKNLLLFLLCFPLAVAYLIYQEKSHGDYYRHHDHKYPFGQFTHISQPFACLFRVIFFLVLLERAIRPQRATL
jgi:hypothetical protein